MALNYVFLCLKCGGTGRIKNTAFRACLKEVYAEYMDFKEYTGVDPLDCPFCPSILECIRGETISCYYCGGKGTTTVLGTTFLLKEVVEGE